MTDDDDDDFKVAKLTVIDDESTSFLSRMSATMVCTARGPIQAPWRRDQGQKILSHRISHRYALCRRGEEHHHGPTNRNAALQVEESAHRLLLKIWRI